MVWSPIEVILILVVWLPLALVLIFTPYVLTIFSIMMLGSGSYAIVQTNRSTTQVWFGLLTGVFLTVLAASSVILLVTALQF